MAGTGEKRNQRQRENQRSFSFRENHRNNNGERTNHLLKNAFCILFRIWTSLTSPNAMVLTLPFPEGRYSQLAPLLGDSSYLWAARTAQLCSFLDRSPPSSLQGVQPVRQRTKKIPERNKPESPCLDPLSSIPGCSSYSSLHKICSWRRGAKWNKPSRFLWREPSTKKDYCSHEAEDNQSLQRENSSSDVSSAPAFTESVP